MHMSLMHCINKYGHVTCRSGDHYEWNKAVTCIHNVLSQQRWLEHYGEVIIKNTKSDVCTCKITFVKVRKPSCTRSVNRGVPLESIQEVAFKVLLMLFICLLLFSLVTGALTTVRTRCRVWFWTKLGRWSIALEVSGMKAFFVTLCLHQSASGSQVSSHSSEVMEMTTAAECFNAIKYTVNVQ